MFWRAGMREGGKPLPLAFQYLILLVQRPWDLSLATKCEHFKLRGLQFHFIKRLKKRHFEASEDIMTKVKSQGLYKMRIKY